MPSIKDKIENRLASLIGKKLSGTTRTLNMQCLQFGDLKVVEDGEVGEQSVHVSCDWRIVGKTLYTGSQDIRFDKDGYYDKEIDWDFDTYRDVMLKQLLKGDDLVARNAVADEFGGFDVLFEKGIKFQVMPMTGSMDRVNEYWRVFVPTEESEHFVVTSRGVK